MQLTKHQLKQIILEEAQKLLNEKRRSSRRNYSRAKRYLKQLLGYSIKDRRVTEQNYWGSNITGRKLPHYVKNPDGSYKKFPISDEKCAEAGLSAGCHKRYLVGHEQEMTRADTGRYLDWDEVMAGLKQTVPGFNLIDWAALLVNYFGRRDAYTLEGHRTQQGQLKSGIKPGSWFEEPGAPHGMPKDPAPEPPQMRAAE